MQKTWQIWESYVGIAETTPNINFFLINS